MSRIKIVALQMVSTPDVGRNREEGEGVVIATLGAQRIAEVRRQLPAQQHRRGI